MPEVRNTISFAIVFPFHIRFLLVQALKQVLEETTEKVMRRDAPAGPGKYSIV
jgi:hypothetical protein